MKKIKLTAKERKRADGDWTIVSRPQPDGRYMVAAVNIKTGNTYGRPEYADDKMGVGTVSRSILRMMDKMGGTAGKMGSKARHRPGKKMAARSRAARGESNAVERLGAIIEAAPLEERFGPRGKYAEGLAGNDKLEISFGDFLKSSKGVVGELAIVNLASRQYKVSFTIREESDIDTLKTAFVRALDKAKADFKKST